MTTKPEPAESEELTAEQAQPRPGQQVIWSQQRKWGGKQSVPVIFLRPVGLFSARIKVDGLGNKTVRWSSLSWEQQ